MRSSTPAPPIPVLHKGKSCAVIDKPAGLAVESDGPDSVVKRLATEIAPPGGRAWPRIVHRLDTGTSGCLCVALNQRGEKALAQGFLDGEIEKQYLALLTGPVPDTGKFDTPYGPDPRDTRRHTTRIDTPRRARLAWKLVERFKGAALVRVVLDTGRTHQIRVQFSEAGFPVIGDPTYVSSSTPAPAPIEAPSATLDAPIDAASTAKHEPSALEARLQAAARHLARPGLHAASLSLIDPDGDGVRRISCEAPVPADLARAMEILRAS